MSNNSILKKRSNLWMHFTPISGSFQAKCDICGTHISHRGGSTSNLAKHIRSKHPGLAEGLTTRNKKFQPTWISTASFTATTATTELAVSVSNEEKGISADQSSGMCLNVETALPSQSARKQQSQQKLTSYVVRPTTVARQKRLDSLLLKMIVSDFQPFSVVEDKGFREFVTALDPSYAIPSRWIVTKDLLVTAYNKAVDQVKELLSTAEAVCLTTDSWTSICTENYIAVAAHYITADFNVG